MRSSRLLAVLVLLLLCCGSRINAGSLAAERASQAGASPAPTVLRGHAGEVDSLQFSPDGTTLASGDDKGFVKVWSVTNKKELHTEAIHKGGVEDLAFSADGKIVFAISSLEGVKVWNLAKRSVSSVTKEGARCLALSSDGKTIACGGFGGVKLVDFPTGRLLKTLETGFVAYDDNPERGNVIVTRKVAFSPDGRRLVSADAKVRVWDTAAADKAKQLFMVGELKEGVRNDIEFVAFTPDAKQVISVQDDGAIRYWDSTTGKLLRTLQGRTASISSGAMTADGKRLVCGSYAKKLVLWDLIPGKEFESLSTDGKVRRVAISSDGARIAAVGSDQVIWIWDVSDKR